MEASHVPPGNFDFSLTFSGKYKSVATDTQSYPFQTHKY